MNFSKYRFDQTIILFAAIFLSMVFCAPVFAQQSQKKLTIEIIGDGEGRVTSNPTGINNCTKIGGANCSKDFDQGTLVALAAEETGGHFFIAWQGDGCVGTGACNVTMDQDRTIRAIFSRLQSFRITASFTGQGSVESDPLPSKDGEGGINCVDPSDLATCSQMYPRDAAVVLIAKPASGYEMAGWTDGCEKDLDVGGGTSVGTGKDTVCIVKADKNKIINAIFVPVNTNTITLNAHIIGKGKITSAPAGINCNKDCKAVYRYTDIQEVTLTATPEHGNIFVGWSGPGSHSCTDPTATTCTVPLTTGEIDITATFEDEPEEPEPEDPKFSTLTIRKYGEGIITSVPPRISCGSTCSAKFEKGQTVTLKAIPAPGYRMTHWGGGNACLNNHSTQCMLAMTSSRTVAPNFVSDVCESRQFSHAEERILDMFVAYYGRAPYSGGLQYWVGELNKAGGDIYAIIYDFGTAGGEYQRRIKSLQNNALVEQLYKNILGRAADTAGLQYYTRELTLQRATPMTIAIEILDGIQPADSNVLENRKRVARHFAVKTERTDKKPFDETQLAVIMDKVTAVPSSVNAACDSLTAGLNRP